MYVLCGFMLHACKGVGHGPSVFDDHSLHPVNIVGIWCHSRQSVHEGGKNGGLPEDQVVDSEAHTGFSVASATPNWLPEAGVTLCAWKDRYAALGSESDSPDPGDYETLAHVRIRGRHGSRFLDNASNRHRL